MKTYLPYLLSLITIIVMWTAGSRWRYTWLLSLFNQALWLTWIIATQAWGLLPMNVALVYVAIRNHRKWRAEWKSAIKQMKDNFAKLDKLVEQEAAQEIKIKQYIHTVDSNFSVTKKRKEKEDEELRGKVRWRKISNAPDDANPALPLKLMPACESNSDGIHKWSNWFTFQDGQYRQCFTCGFKDVRPA